MLDDDQRVMIFLQDGHELKDGEATADLQCFELAVQPGKDAGVISGHVEHLEPLQVQVAIQSLDEHLTGGYEGVEGPGPKGDRRIKLEVHAKELALAGLKGWPRAERFSLYNTLVSH